MVKRCADCLGETVGKIKNKMIGSALGHFDETGTRVDKKFWWVHDASNCEYTYLDISPKRGTAGMEQCGVLPEFKGIAMHDCWASYWNYPDIQHAVCCAHLLRELTGIDENHPDQKWASAFIDLLLEMKKVKDKAVEKGKDSLSCYHYHKFDKKYDELIEQARKENPLPETTEKKRGRKKKEFSYATSDKKVATVSSKRKIKAVGKGTCIIYGYARNGYAKKVKVTVE